MVNAHIVVYVTFYVHNFLWHVMTYLLLRRLWRLYNFFFPFFTSVFAIFTVFFKIKIFQSGSNVSCFSFLNTYISEAIVFSIEKS